MSHTVRHRESGDSADSELGEGGRGHESSLFASESTILLTCCIYVDSPLSAPPPGEVAEAVFSCVAMERGRIAAYLRARSGGSCRLSAVGQLILT